MSDNVPVNVALACVLDAPSLIWDAPQYRDGIPYMELRRQTVYAVSRGALDDLNESFLDELQELFLEDVPDHLLPYIDHEKLRCALDLDLIYDTVSLSYDALIDWLKDNELDEILRDEAIADDEFDWVDWVDLQDTVFVIRE